VIFQFFHNGKFCLQFENTERGKLCTDWMDNIKTWTGLPVEESVRKTRVRDKWRKYVHGVADPRIEDNKRTEQQFMRRTRYHLMFTVTKWTAQLICI